jgi:hypothetical protein
MARPERAALLLSLLWAGAALAVSRPPDPLEPVKSAIRLKDFTAASATLQRLAAAGNSEAQYLLGAFYLNGLGGAPDQVAARSWLEKAAALGHARAAFSLAALCSDAEPPDRECATRWLSRARALGFAPAPQPAGAHQGLPSSLLPAAQLTDPAVRREALWLAAADGDLPSLELLADAALVGARDEFGRGALARAAEAGSAPAVALLIQRAHAGGERRTRRGARGAARGPCRRRSRRSQRQHGAHVRRTEQTLRGSRAAARGRRERGGARCRRVVGARLRRPARGD